MIIMTKTLLILSICLSSQTSFGQDLTVKKSDKIFDCQILKAIFSDTAIFKRRFWSYEKKPLVLNDFKDFFNGCPSQKLFDRDIVLINDTPGVASDTLTILNVVMENNKYTILFFHPRTGCAEIIQLKKSNSKYYIVKHTSGAF